MIVEEETLELIFDQIPLIVAEDTKSYKVKFHWGGEKDLVLFLKQESGNRYPLIWLVENEGDVSEYGHTLNRKSRLIIAKNSEHKTNRNPEVWKTEFKDILNPLLEKVIKCLEKSGVTYILDGRYKIKRRANYTESVNEDESCAIDFWNVIVLDCEIVFSEKADGTANCINNIRF